MTGHKKLSELYAELYGKVPDWVMEREHAIDKEKKLKDAHVRLCCSSRDKKRLIVDRNKDGKRTYITKRASANKCKPTHVEKLDC